MRPAGLPNRAITRSLNSLAALMSSPKWPFPLRPGVANVMSMSDSRSLLPQALAISVGYFDRRLSISLSTSVERQFQELPHFAWSDVFAISAARRASPAG